MRSSFKCARPNITSNMPGCGRFTQYGPWTDCSYPHPAKNVIKLQTWYPNFQAHLTYVLATNCTSEYDFYTTHSPILERTKCNIAPVVSCLLGIYDQLGAADMSAATVLLGLLPTMLSLFGCTVEEIGILGLRRPSLVFLLGAGSSAIWPFSSFRASDPRAVLH